VDRYCKSKEYKKQCPEEKWGETIQEKFSKQKAELSYVNDSNPNKERLKEALDKREKELKEEKRTYEGNVEIWSKCIAARVEVRRLFEEAIETAKSDADRDPTLRPDVGRLHVRWASGQEEHINAIPQAEQGKKKCEDILKYYP
jgi:hypothetical protein